jgi:hypothetical protein
MNQVLESRTPLDQAVAIQLAQHFHHNDFGWIVAANLDTPDWTTRKDRDLCIGELVRDQIRPNRFRLRQPISSQPRPRPIQRHSSRPRIDRLNPIHRHPKQPQPRAAYLPPLAQRRPHLLVSRRHPRHPDRRRIRD